MFHAFYDDGYLASAIALSRDLLILHIIGYKLYESENIHKMGLTDLMQAVVHCLGFGQSAKAKTLSKYHDPEDKLPLSSSSEQR